MLKYFDPSLNAIYEKEKLGKQLAEIRKSKDGIVAGAYRIFQDGKLIQDTKENLTVAMGRQYVAQRIFGIAHAGETEVEPTVTVPIWDWKITHFGLGSGGAVVVGNYVNLLGPEQCDNDLYAPLPLSGSPGDSSYLTSPGDTAKGVSPTAFVAKPIRPSGTIDIVASDDLNCAIGQIYSYARIICTKYPGEPNYLENDDDYLNINEAALYYSNGDTKVRTFAHICFTPKYTQKKSELVIEWYVLC